MNLVRKRIYANAMRNLNTCDATQRDDSNMSTTSPLSGNSLWNDTDKGGLPSSTPEKRDEDDIKRIKDHTEDDLDDDEDEDEDHESDVSDNLDDGASSHTQHDDVSLLKFYYFFFNLIYYLLGF